MKKTFPRRASRKIGYFIKQSLDERSREMQSILKELQILRGELREKKELSEDRSAISRIRTLKRKSGTKKKIL